MKLGKNSSKEDKKTDAEKVEERREEVLAKGRKFKYPLQWVKRRIVASTILISFIMIALLVVFGWLSLYRFQMTDAVIYRVTTVLPVTVAQVDGESVRFSDYLMLYRSSILPVEEQSGTDDESYEDLKKQYKRGALTKAEEYAYAAKLARENEVAVTDAEVDAEFERHRTIGGIDRSEEGFLKVLSDNFDLSKDEYKRLLRLTLTKAKVEEKIDKNAEAVAKELDAALLANQNDYAAAANALGEKVTYEETGGLVDSKNVDGGRASEAMKLEPGQSSGRFLSMNGDGYYYVKLVNKTETEVNFVSIKIAFTEFGKRFAEIQENNRIFEFINLE